MEGEVLWLVPMVIRDGTQRASKRFMGLVIKSVDACRSLWTRVGIFKYHKIAWPPLQHYERGDLSEEEWSVTQAHSVMLI